MSTQLFLFPLRDETTGDGELIPNEEAGAHLSLTVSLLYRSKCHFEFRFIAICSLRLFNAVYILMLPYWSIFNAGGSLHGTKSVDEIAKGGVDRL